MRLRLEPDDLAFPIKSPDSSDSLGLTKREYFAAMAMQGIQANPGSWNFGTEQIADLAIDAADALIAALNDWGEQ